MADATFGYTEVGGSDYALSDTTGRGLVCPDLGSDPTGGVYNSGLTYPTWPDPIAWTEDQKLISIYATYDDGTLACSKLTAYVKPSGGSINFIGAIYQGTSKVAETQQASLGSPEGWLDLPFASPPTLQTGTEYTLAILVEAAPTLIAGDLAPLTLADAADVLGALRAGMAHSSLIALVVDWRLGLREDLAIDVLDDLGGVGRSGPCAGRYISDEDGVICDY